METFIFVFLGLCLALGIWAVSKNKQKINKKEVIPAVIVIVIMVGVFRIFTGGSSSTAPQPAPIQDRKTMSIVYAESVIKNTLKAPSTAKFENVDAYELANQKDIWAVNGYVDSQNSFGAMLRSQWEVQLDYSNGKGGTVKSILFDGKKIQ